MLSPNDGRNHSLEFYIQHCAIQDTEVKIFHGVSIADPAGLNQVTFAFRNAGKRLVRVKHKYEKPGHYFSHASETHYLEPGEEVQIGTQGEFPEVVAFNNGL